MAFLMLVAGGTPALAQVSASLSGRVDDATGAGVGGASVTVKSLETGATRTTTTDQSGDYKILSLPLGAQELTVEKTGFKQVVRTGINLQVGEEAVANVSLQIGEIAQQVTISEENPIVNTTTSQNSGLVNEREIKDLPLNGRGFDNLITLNPGAVAYNLKSANTSTSNGNTFSVDGRRPAENIFLMNGIEYTGTSQLAITPGGVSGQLLGIDAVREFNVLTDTYSAEYGKRSGAQVNVVTQSGTNALHGTVFEFLRNSALDARNYFDQGAIPPFRRNQFGGALGGPLKKNKLFLFGNYEGFRQALAVSNVTVVPDLSTATGVTTINPGMLKYLAMWPAANGPKLGGGAALSYNHPRSDVREDFGTTRMDYAIRDRDTLTGSYTIDDGDSLTPQPDPLFGSYSILRNQVASIQETHIFSPQMLNVFRAGFSRAAYDLDPASLATFSPDLSFVTGGGPGGIVIGGGRRLRAQPRSHPRVRTTPRTYGTGETFLLIRMIFRSPKEFIRSARGSGCNACRITRMPPPEPRRGHVLDACDIPCRHGEHLSGSARPQRARLEKLLRRLVYPGHDPSGSQPDCESWASRRIHDRLE